MPEMKPLHQKRFTYDQVAKETFLKYGKDLLELSLSPEVHIAQILEIVPEDKEIVMPRFLTERRADMVSRIRTRRGVLFLAVSEFQTEYTLEKVMDMVIYGAVRSKWERLPVCLIMILLKPPAQKIEDEFYCFYRQAPIKVKIVRMWELDGYEVLKQKKLGLISFAALMKHQEASAYAWIRKVLLEVLDFDLSLEEKQRLISSILTYVPARYSKAELEEMLEKLRKEETMLEKIIEESPFVQLMMERGMEKGMEKGMERGMERGMEQGLQQGIQRGILSVLSLKNGGIPSWMEEKIRSIRDRDTLDGLLKMAVTASDRKTVEAYLMGGDHAGS